MDNSPDAHLDNYENSGDRDKPAEYYIHGIRAYKGDLKNAAASLRLIKQAGDELYEKDTYKDGLRPLPHGERGKDIKAWKSMSLKLGSAISVLESLPKIAARMLNNEALDSDRHIFEALRNELDYACGMLDAVSDGKIIGMSDDVRAVMRDQSVNLMNNVGNLIGDGRDMVNKILAYDALRISRIAEGQKERPDLIQSSDYATRGDTAEVTKEKLDRLDRKLDRLQKWNKGFNAGVDATLLQNTESWENDPDGEAKSVVARHNTTMDAGFASREALNNAIKTKKITPKEFKKMKDDPYSLRTRETADKIGVDLPSLSYYERQSNVDKEAHAIWAKRQKTPQKEKGKTYEERIKDRMKLEAEQKANPTNDL